MRLTAGLLVLVWALAACSGAGPERQTGPRDLLVHLHAPGTKGDALRVRQDCGHLPVVASSKVVRATPMEMRRRRAMHKIHPGIEVGSPWQLIIELRSGYDTREAASFGHCLTSHAAVGSVGASL